MMDLKIAGLCITLVVLTENIESRHLTGGRPPSIFGYPNFRFPGSFGFQGSIPGLRRAGLTPRQFPRIGQLGDASSPFGISPFRSRFRSSRFPSLSPLGENGLSLSRRQIGGRSRLPMRPFRLNPTLSSARRRILPRFAGTRSRLPFLYYNQRGNTLTGGPRARSILPNDAIRQLRQRFRTTGTGTRDDPIRIISPLSATSGALQRPSRSRRRPVQLSRARQQLQQRQQEEVIALFGFDQPAGASIGVPVLSETIDRQTKIKRTPIEKSLSTDSKTIKSTESKGLQSVNISKPITDEFLQKLNVHQLERLAKGVAEATKPQIQHEVKHVAKVTEELSVKKQTLKTSIPADIESLKTVTKESLLPETPAIKHVGVPISVNPVEIMSETVTTEAKTAIFDPEPVLRHANEGHSLPKADIVSKDPSGISVIADTIVADIHNPVDSSANLITSGMAKAAESIASAEMLLPAENLRVSDIVVPVEATIVPEIVKPVDSVQVSEGVVPVEISAEVTPTAGEGPVIDVVPVESSAEVIATVKGVPVNDVLVAIEPSAEVITSAKGVPVTDVVVPVDASTEVITNTDAPVNDVLVPVESSAEVLASAEGVPVTGVVVPFEASAEVIASVEGGPVTDVVPVDAPVKVIANTEAAVTDVAVSTEASAEVIATAEGVSVIDAVVPVEVSAEVIATAEITPITDVVVPVEVSAEVISTAEGAPVTDYVVPIESAAAISEVVATVESFPISNAIGPVETSAKDDMKTDVVVPMETSTKVMAPVESSITLDKVVQNVSTGITSSSQSMPIVSTGGKVPLESSVFVDSPIAEIAFNEKKISTKPVSIEGHETHTGIPVILEQHVDVGKSVHPAETTPIPTKTISLR